MESQRSNLQVVSLNVDDDEILVSKFDCSVDNHFHAMDKIATLSGESEPQTDIPRFSSSVTFLREWRNFCYQPRAVRFACEKDKDVAPQINLPQFSSALVPKDSSYGNKDFVMNVGGHVWALDWCPKLHQNSNTNINVEFIAVAAHPPESSYHKIGAPLTGRGLIQIWCMLNSCTKEQDKLPLVKVKPKKSSQNDESTDPEIDEPKKKRGRPKKITVPNQQDIIPLVKVKPKKSSQNDESTDHEIDEPKKKRGRPKKITVPNQQDIIPLVKVKPKNNEVKVLETNEPKRKRGKLTKNVSETVPDKDSCPQLLAIEFPQHSPKSLDIDKVTLSTPESVESPQHPPELLAIDDTTPDISDNIPEEVALPRLVMGLAHNGKVAWDVKWKPDSYDVCEHRMGYLAVLLGNGGLQVWEVPLLRANKALFSSCKKQGTDPRFLKLKPVFMCSKLKCGDRQSIPLTLEWSTSSPHDLILAGCHDGVVALWKFCANGPSKDTRPLLCFSADTVPIRSLKWVPVPSDPESTNIIAIAGHKGVRFWDIRDPFHPLWDIPSQKIIYSLDWHPDPRCVILSCDDGEIKIINLLKAASDVSVTGTPTVKTQQHGSHGYYCSSSSIWCVQVSPLTGMVAYCCSDGKVVHFQNDTNFRNMINQLTPRSVEKDPNRNREPHYLCGSVTKKDDSSTLTVVSPLPNVPIPMKKSTNEWGDTPRSKRGFVSTSNQERRAKEYSPKIENKTSQALVCVDDVNEKQQHEEKEKEKEESFPPKVVAMHRVRWNMNKGSERWLCYGGAAGILRCQEINLLGTKKKKKKLHD
ncbi:hypothetical protein LXL04_032544 [Taraxacum kok-saghyz]